MLVEINKKQYDSLVKIAAAFEVEVEWLVEKGLKESIKTDLEVVEIIEKMKPLEFEGEGKENE